MSPGCLLAKIDLESAYRSVPLHPDCFSTTGLYWDFESPSERVFLYDARLPFGAARSCKVFQSLSDSIVRIMQRHGYTCVSYIDDFMVIGDDELKCKQAFDFLVQLMSDLGFKINWNKVTLPATLITFLGVEIDTNARTMSLPPNKLDDVRVLLSTWVMKTKATKKELQRIIGKLNWCARVITGGRTFMRNLINCMCKLKQSNHHTRLSSAARADLAWWVKALDLFHGNTSFTCDLPVPSFEFSTDACLTGAGGQYLSNWFHVSWVNDLPEMVGTHINGLELKTVEIAAELWGHLWEGSHIRFFSDSSVVVACINKGTSRSTELLGIIQMLFWLSFRHKFKLSAAFIPGKLNLLSDRLSRLDNPVCAVEAQNWLSGSDGAEVECCGSISYETYLCLQGSWGTA